MSISGYCRGADFCDEIAGKTDITFRRVYDGVPPSRTVAKTESFVVVADLSPLTIGHLLLLPHRHYLSFASVIRHHPDELRDLLDWLLPRYGSTFGTPTLLEHGSSADVDSSACITHAHWHLLPVDGSAIGDAIAEDGLAETELCAPTDLDSPPWSNSPYFFISYNGRHRVFTPCHGLRRQYLRSIASRQLRIPDPEWDYAVVVRKNLLRSTMDEAGKWLLDGSVDIGRLW